MPRHREAHVAYMGRLCRLPLWAACLAFPTVALRDSQASQEKVTLDALGPLSVEELQTQVQETRDDERMAMQEARYLERLAAVAELRLMEKRDVALRSEQQLQETLATPRDDAHQPEPQIVSPVGSPMDESNAEALTNQMQEVPRAAPEVPTAISPEHPLDLSPGGPLETEKASDGTVAEQSHVPLQESETNKTSIASNETPSDLSTGGPLETEKDGAVSEESEVPLQESKTNKTSIARNETPSDLSTGGPLETDKDGTVSEQSQVPLQESETNKTSIPSNETPSDLSTGGPLETDKTSDGTVAEQSEVPLPESETNKTSIASNETPSDLSTGGPLETEKDGAVSEESEVPLQESEADKTNIASNETPPAPFSLPVAFAGRILCQDNMNTASLHMEIRDWPHGIFSVTDKSQCVSSFEALGKYDPRWASAPKMSFTHEKWLSNTCNKKPMQLEGHFTQKFQSFAGAVVGDCTNSRFSLHKVANSNAGPLPGVAPSPPPAKQVDCSGRKAAAKGSEVWCSCNVKAEPIASKELCEHAGGGRVEICEWSSEKSSCLPKSQES